MTGNPSRFSAKKGSVPINSDISEVYETSPSPSPFKKVNTTKSKYLSPIPVSPKSTNNKNPTSILNVKTQKDSYIKLSKTR